MTQRVLTLSATALLVLLAGCTVGARSGRRMAPSYDTTGEASCSAGPAVLSIGAIVVSITVPHLVLIVPIPLARAISQDHAAETTRRKRWMDALVADVNRRYPGFAGAVAQAEIATARTMKSHLGTPHGEVYGFRPTPARLFGRPPSAATSIAGLWLSSAYTVSGGYSGAMHGGLMAADAAWKKRVGK